MYHLNVQSSKTTGKLPYELVFGQLPQTTLFPDCNVNVIDEEKLDNGERESNLDDPACTDDIVHEVSDTEEDQVPATELIDSDTDSKSSSIIIQDNDDDPISTEDTESNVQSKCYKTHEDHRSEARDKTYSSASKMANYYNKQKNVCVSEFSVDDIVSILIPRIDRSSTDMPRLPCKIIRVCGNVTKMYKLACRHGVLNGMFRSGDLVSYSGDVVVNLDTMLSLCEASRKENGNKFIRNSCNCLSGCTTRKCACKVNGILCSSHCHPSNVCLNREVDVSQSTSESLPIRDKKLLNRCNGWLNDNIIRMSCNIMKKDNPGVSGLQDPLLQQNYSWAVPNFDFVQILHVNACRWIAISNIGQEENHVGVYDSLCSKPSKETKELIKKYMQRDHITLNVMNVHRQVNGSDCGVFAIAFSKSLLSGMDPCQLSYIYPRKHLYDSMTCNTLPAFPSGTVLRHPRVVMSEQI